MAQTQLAGPTEHSVSRSNRAWRQFRRNRLAIVGLVIILVLWGLPC